MNKNIDSIKLKQLFLDWSKGCNRAENELIQYFYPKIKNIAHRQFKAKHSYALQTTEIVSEAFMHFGKSKAYQIEKENQFLSLCSKIIRRIVVDHYRSENRVKRGGEDINITLDRMVHLIDKKTSSEFDWLMVDRLLSDLETFDPQAAEIVELKIFSGLTIPEISTVLSISQSSVSRNWKVARLWVMKQLKN